MSELFTFLLGSSNMPELIPICPYLPFLPNECHSSKSEDSIDEDGLLLLLAVGEGVELVLAVEVGQEEGVDVETVAAETEWGKGYN